VTAPSLRGMRIALLESRMASELASLVVRSSGVPYCVPAVREAPRPRPREVVDTLAWLARAPRVAVFTTGSGVDALFEQARAIGLEDALHGGLLRSTLVCRGPKPVAALKKQGLVATVRVESPYTTRELARAFDALPLDGEEVLFVHYGERSADGVAALDARGARVRELLVYEWQLPEDLTPLERLIDEIVERRVAAVAFTSQVQLRHLLEVARRLDRRAELVEALRGGTVVAAIGPTCAEALRAEGVTASVVASPPKMGPLVASLARHLEETHGSNDPH
jgi:uroporphyrinogen-III synthase